MAISRISPSLIASGATGSFALDLTGSDQFVVVLATCSANNVRTATDITLDSVSGTLLGHISIDGGRAASVSAYYWKEAGLPVTGGSYTITATWSGGINYDTLTVLEWAGVDQTSPVSALASGTDTIVAPATTIASTLAGESGNYGITFLATADNGITTSSNTLPASASSIALLDNGEQSTQIGEDAVIASASETYTWTPSWGSNTIDAVDTGSFALLAAAGSSPVLSLPTETSITATTATVGATTDSATGTLYYYISTSATAPSAADLKAGTGSVTFGSDASLSVGANTFAATGLTASTTYYTYFIQNDGASDSNILESGSWATIASGPTITNTTDPATTGSELTITGTGFGATQGTGGVTQEQGAVVVALTENTWGDTSITADSATIESTGLKYGVQTIEVTDDSSQTATDIFTANPVAGNDYVDLTSIDGVASNRITAIADLAIGDQLRYENITTPGSYAVTVNADATFSIDGAAPDGVYTFEVRAWDTSDQTWGTAATQTATLGTPASGGDISNRITIGIEIGI